MLTLNAVNFISENDQFILVSFFFKKEVFFVSHTTAKKNCHGICCIIRYFWLQRRMLCQSITEFPESRMFAGMNNETPGLLQYTYACDIDILATELSNYICQTQQNLIYRFAIESRFYNFSHQSDLKEVQIKILPYFVLCTFRLIDNITKQIIFRSFMLNYRFLNLWD